MLDYVRVINFLLLLIIIIYFYLFLFFTFLIFCTPKEVKIPGVKN